MEGKIIVITSGKGGVGKTTATAALGAAIALEGKRVAVVDMDIGLRNLDVVMGLENRIVFNVVDLAKGRCKVRQAAIKDRRIENLFLIPASQSDNKTALSTDDMIRLCKKLRQEFDVVLIDCPAGIEQGFENSVIGADEAVVVCTPEVSAVRDADRIIGLLYARSITPKLIVNRIVPRLVASGDMLSHKDVVDVLSIELIGLVCMDDFVITSTNTGTPVVLDRDSRAGQAFRRIAARLLGNTEIPIVDPLEDLKGFWNRISSKMGLRKT
ncbi:septum site-determining protein MinD [Desulfobotulus mexicanus]|uniref:Septum site-determining protein MinD n=1 Tax=Desulfobotulus mexicanus TaxID=2586642 RepID=A0A5S5MFY0_9BACT|nr:septum site-determining protein MinD [Desulfobotulus mexicanus]TYT74535.1 septum site-determining protein MinD [Desulfobotulus mexicanus]